MIITTIIIEIIVIIIKWTSDSKSTQNVRLETMSKVDFRQIFDGLMLILCFGMTLQSFLDTLAIWSWQYGVSCRSAL